MPILKCHTGQTTLSGFLVSERLVRTCLYDGSGVRVHNTMGLRNIRFRVGYWFIFVDAFNIRAFTRLIYVYGRKSNKS